MQISCVKKTPSPAYHKTHQELLYTLGVSLLLLHLYDLKRSYKHTNSNKTTS
jgi:hypothetical protein